MAFKFNQAGKERALSMLLNKTTSTSAVTMKLYKTTATTPVWANTQTPASFTECTEAGYAAQAMTGASWTLSTPAGEEDKASYPQITFTFTEAATVYGYYLVNAAGELIGAELFNGTTGYTLGSSGGNIKVTLTLSLT